MTEMYEYDPLIAPDPDEWLAMDEDERVMAVSDYHRGAGVELPNAQLHAAMHAVVENQVLMGDETAAEATLGRLMREGLDRHDAIHAVGSVLAELLWELQAKGPMGNVEKKYDRKLRKLTARKWLRSAG